MTATTPTPVWSGFCNVARHHACRGAYSGHPCPCDCHQQPEPEPEPPSTLPDRTDSGRDMTRMYARGAIPDGDGPPAVLIARCENFREVEQVPCTGELRFRWGQSQAACSTCGGWSGIAVARWDRVATDGR